MLILDPADITVRAEYQGANTQVATRKEGDTLDIDLGGSGFADKGENTSVDGQGGYSVYDQADSNAGVVVDDGVTVI